MKVNKAGIIHVPEGRLLFPGLTVYKNLQGWHGFMGRKPYEQDIRMVYDLFPRLQERKDQFAWSLSGGEQQMLAIGRGMARPKLLMLDEPSMGLAPLIVKDVFEKIVEVNQKMGISILLVEQNARIALRVSDYAYVIEQGRIVMQGEAKALQNDPRIINAYLFSWALCAACAARGFVVRA
nr:ATP-binding cassette domain-containing protein [Maliibacterium massiliense]